MRNLYTPGTACALYPRYSDDGKDDGERMESNKTMAAVIAYIEETLLEEIDYKRIAAISRYPSGLFQRVFAFVAGMTIAEYVRRRRLSLAAFELQRDGAKIIDIALRYGYESPSSFTRAFKEQHGCSPTDARSGIGKLREFPPFSFHNQRIVGGRTIMADLKRIEYVRYGARKLVGKDKRVTFYNAGEFWQECSSDGTFDELAKLEDYWCSDVDDYVGIGHMSQFDDNNESFRYVIGKLVHADAPVPDGMAVVDIPEGVVAKAWVEGEFSEIINSAYFLVTEGIGKNGYAVDRERFYWCDMYTCARFSEPMGRGERLVAIDYFMPVTKDS